MAAILTNGVLKIRTAPIFQPLLAPARYKGSGSTKARDGGNRVNNRPRELIHPSASPGAALPAPLPSSPQPQPAADHPCWVSLQQVSL